MYEIMANQYGIKWNNRKYNPSDWEQSDTINKALSAATACLYGICEAAILAAGYAPAIGFIHTGKPQSFVYDIADIFKFETVIPIAFKETAKESTPIERAVRQGCRDSFRNNNLLKKIIPTIEEILDAGGIEKPAPHSEAVPIAIEEKKGYENAGHCS